MAKKEIGKKKIHFKYNFSVYWSFLKKYKLLFLSILFMALIVEASFLVPKLLLKEIIDKGNELTSGSLTSELYISLLFILLAVYISVVIIRVIGNWFSLHLMNKLSGNMIFDLKNRFFKHILHLDHNFHTTHKTGSLISRLLRGANGVERMSEVVVFSVAPLFFQITIVGISLLYFNVLSAVSLLVVVITFVAYSFYVQNKQKFSNVDYNNTEDREKAYIGDVFTNIDSIKYFGKEKNIDRKYSDLAWKSRLAIVKFLSYFRWLSAGQSLILGLGSFLLVYFPLMGFLEGEISIGTVVFIYTVYGNVVGPMFSFVHGIRGYYRSMADFEALFQYSKIENEIEDWPSAGELVVNNGEIEFNNIDFNYGKRKLFRDFNLKINKNEKVALVGHSGCGKTTLVKLLYRLYDVDRGNILIDGKDIRKFKQESLRSELSIVPQECILFDDTIYNNIRFSNPKASDRQIRNAMKFAQLDRFVESFPKKEKTIVGERGVRLSGGEKQRVSIARALLADKNILILDEATSSLDSKTEHEIQKDLEKLMKGKTSIIIAHRLSTIMKADKIVVMDNGKIVQIGKHKDLIKKRGLYKELWDLQKDGFIEE